MSTSRWMAVAGSVVGAAGVAVCVFHFATGDPWFSVGRVVCLVGFGLIVGAYLSRRRHTAEDSFDAGYQTGFYRGQRVKPKIINLRSVHDRERSSHR